MKKLLTIAIIDQDGRVLLGMKKRGFGAGKWNGFGGKVELNESIVAAAKRELQEEAGVEVVEMKEVGVLTFTFESEPTIREAHVFRVTKFRGTPRETDEMRPMWFSEHEVPLKEMWAADAYWMPMFLANKDFVGQFHYDRPTTPEYTAQILRQELHEKPDQLA